MRISISAQSWLSVPPAPGCTVTIAFSGSVSPESIVRVSSSSAYLPSDGDLALQLRLHRLALARQLEVRLHVAGPPLQLDIEGKLLLQPLALAHQHLRLRRLSPHRGIAQLLFYCFELRAHPRGVKDTPAGRARDRARERRQIPDRST